MVLGFGFWCACAWGCCEEGDFVAIPVGSPVATVDPEAPSPAPALAPPALALALRGGGLTGVDAREGDDPFPCARVDMRRVVGAEVADDGAVETDAEAGVDAEAEVEVEVAEERDASEEGRREGSVSGGRPCGGRVRPVPAFERRAARSMSSSSSGEREEGMEMLLRASEWWCECGFECGWGGGGGESGLMGR